MASINPVAGGNQSELAQADVVRAHFRDNVGYWHDLYHRDDVEAAVFQDRQEAAVARILEAALPRGAQILEVGCGAGFLTVDLASRGFRVTAVDVAPEMLEVARSRVAVSGFGNGVHLAQADVHALEHRDRSFDLVVALGVIPWLHSPAVALSEISRVLQPGGRLVITSDNRARLNHLLDPFFSPLLARPRQAARALGRWIKKAPAQTGFEQNMYWTGRFRALVTGAGLEVISDQTVGFGPFSFLGRPLLWGRHGVALHRRLQSLADRGLPLMRSTGNHHIVVARKPNSSSA